VGTSINYSLDAVSLNSISGCKVTSTDYSIIDTVGDKVSTSSSTSVTYLENNGFIYQLGILVSPTISSQPSSITVTSGSSASFSVTASGTSPLIYQWYFNSNPISGATSSTYSINTTSPANGGSYRVTITNGAGSVTSSTATLIVNTGPAITIQPNSQSVLTGSSITFTATATGSGTLSYQWYKNGSSISGATSSTYTISSVALADAANYTVVVTNSVSNVTSDVAVLSVASAVVAPTIATQPATQSVNVGSSVTLSVIATGTSPFTYQWYKGSSAVSGATSSSYTISSPAVGDSGSYYVTVTNSSGTATSNTATLTVNVVAPSITSQPSSVTANVGGSVTLSITATGTSPFTYQWYKNNLAISGATNATLTISPLASSDPGSYTVSVSNSASTVTSNAATITVNIGPSISVQPASQTVNAGTGVTFSVTANGTAPFTYQWYKGGLSILGATNSSYTIASPAINDSGSYTVIITNSVGSTTSNSAVLTINSAPVITTQPVSQSVVAGSTVTLSVLANGSGTISYQWQKNATSISGATSSTYTISSTSVSDSANYSVVVTNSFGSVTSTVSTLTVTSAVISPSVITQPTGQNITVGSVLNLSVTAGGSAPFAYQWYLGTAPITGATNASYVVSSASSIDAGTYCVTITNSAGSVTSSNAVVTVSAVAPTITTQPISQSIRPGSTAAFSVVASGTAPLSYQWYLNGSVISGATTSTFSISPVASADAGKYTVVVTNSAGAVTSAAGTLTVNALAPSVSITPPSSLSVFTGSSVSFAIVATGTAPFTYQWYLNGNAIPNATLTTYTIASAALTDSGSYTATVTNSGGTGTSSAVTLTVNAVIISPSITTQPAAQSIIVGNAATLSVSATGTGTLSYQWYKNGIAINGATSTSLTIAATALSDTGSYSVKITNSGGSTTSASAQLLVIDPGRLVNISVLSMDGPGSQLLTIGFVTGGAGTTGSQNLLIRGSGPALNAYNVSPVLPDPTLSVFAGQTIVNSNDNWGSSIANIAAIATAESATGAFALTSTNSLDAALVTSLPKITGGYTVQIAGKDTATGMALAEVYDDTPVGTYVASNPRLVNISCLEQISTGGILTAGFVIGGTTSEKVLIRASGPSLAPFGVVGYIPDPSLTVYNNSTPIAVNTGWAGSSVVSNVSTATGAFPFLNTSSKDSAVVLTLQPGSYTVQATSASGTSGVTLIEVYEVPSN